MRLSNVLQPHYVFRPSQIVRRIGRTWRPPGEIEDVALPWGARLQVDTREVIGHWIVWMGLWDVAVCETLRRLLRPGDVAVDAGANIGCMTTLMAACVGPGGRVVAFEPHPVIGRRLALNVERARASGATARIEIRNEALSAQAGVAQLGAADDDFAQNHGVARIVATGGRPDDAPVERTGTFTVRTVRLDAALGDARVRVLKADVEGHEGAVFAGASGLLERDAITHIVYEDHVGGTSPVHDFLAARGYTVFALGWQLLGPVIADRHVPLSHPGETPDFIATRDPDELCRLMAPRGWRVFRGTPRA